VRARSATSHLTRTGHLSDADPADVFRMSAGGHASDDWPDYIIRPEVVLEAHVAVVRKPALPAVYQESRGDVPALPLLALVIGLAGAAIWFVGIPHLTRAAPIDRGCEVIVLKTGKTKCVANPRAGSNASQSKPAK
jgi:hypothetical protein